MSGKFAHGTTYYHFANPREEWAGTFESMRQMGLDTVRVGEIWPGWEVLEPTPGKYDFDELDEFVRTAEAAGLNVVMGIGINNPPFWVFTDIDDVRCIDVSGKLACRRVQSGNHDNVQYREVMGRFIEAQVKHYSTFANIVAWQFGNEMRYGVPLADNECTRLRFRDWLKGHYAEDLDAVNRTWGTLYRSWDEIYPYMSIAGAPTEGLSTLAIKTRQFQAWSLEELLAWGVGIVKRHSDLPVFHNNFGHSGVCGNHWRQAEIGDLVVQDIYPAGSPNPQVYATFLLDSAVSISRAVKKELWIGETSIGQYGTYVRNRTPQALIETLVMEMVACGIKGLLYFRHKPPKFEQPHKFTGSQTALRRDGSEMVYTQTPRHLTAVMERLGDRILDCAPQTPQVAVYFPEESLMFSFVPPYRDEQFTAIHGSSSLWNRLRYGVDILDTDRITGKDLSMYKVIYLPVSYLLPASVGAVLKNYVEAGGTLIAECRPGYVDENGWLYDQQPGAGLAEVFGAREDLFWNAEDFKTTITLDGKAFNATFNGVCQTLRCDGAEPIAHNAHGEIVATVNRFGNGRAVLLGFAPSFLFPVGGGKYEGTSGSVEAAEADQRAVLESVGVIAEQAGLTRPVEIATSSIGLSTRYLVSDSETLMFMGNHGQKSTIGLPQGARVIARRENGEVVFDGVAGPFELDQFDWAIIAKGK